MIDSSKEDISLGSSKESHHIIIEEEYEVSNSANSSKEEVEENTDGSHKEKLPSSKESKRLIEIDFEPSHSSDINVIPEESEGSSKEKLRPASEQIRLKNYSEYTDGSGKERFVSEVIEESIGHSEATISSEKEQLIERSSKESSKDKPPRSYIEASSLGSGKEEISESRYVFIYFIII